MHLITANDKERILKIRKIVEAADKTDDKTMDFENQSLLETLDRALYNLENGLNYYKPLPESEQKWFDAECGDCGWKGSSQYLLGGHAIGDTGDHSDCTCPVCGSPKID